MDKVIAEGETKAAAISEQYEEGFITEDERHRLTVENWTKIDTQVQEMLAEQMVGQDSSMAIAITSGARGNISQMKMCVGMLGCSV
jgi:DNA-directed RNA polymerase subunit beta'